MADRICTDNHLIQHFFQSVYDCGRDFCGKMGGSDGVASLTIIWYAQGLFGGLFRGYINGVSSVISYNLERGDRERLSLWSCRYWFCRGFLAWMEYGCPLQQVRLWVFLWVFIISENTETGGAQRHKNRTERLLKLRSLLCLFLWYNEISIWYETM